MGGFNEHIAQCVRDIGNSRWKFRRECALRLLPLQSSVTIGRVRLRITYRMHSGIDERAHPEKRQALQGNTGSGV
jgi:hypothetical protein